MRNLTKIDQYTTEKGCIIFVNFFFPEVGEPVLVTFSLLSKWSNATLLSMVLNYKRNISHLNSHKIPQKFSPPPQFFISLAI